MRVEDIWDSLDGQQRQLSHDDKLNSCFDSIPVASFPHAFDGAQLVEIPSDATLAEAVDILSRNRIISAPVRNVDAPEDASWIDRYIGIVEFPGIAVWLLHQARRCSMHGLCSLLMRGTVRCREETLTPLICSFPYSLKPRRRPK